jgi:hypothetical protein
LRFENKVLFNNLEAVVETIQAAIAEASVSLTDHPVCGAREAQARYRAALIKEASRHLLDAAATPPVSGGVLLHQRMRQVY